MHSCITQGFLDKNAGPFLEDSTCFQILVDAHSSLPIIGIFKWV